MANSSSVPHVDGNTIPVWDITNSILALIAIGISIYFAWKQKQSNEFDEQFRLPILAGCKDIKSFMLNVARVKNIQNETTMKEEAVELMGKLPVAVEPLQHALLYFEENNANMKNDVMCMRLYLSLHDDIAKILSHLEGATLNNGWRLRVEKHEKLVYRKLSKIYSNTDQARSIYSRRFKFF